jgi:hypothetical protein
MSRLGGGLRLGVGLGLLTGALGATPAAAQAPAGAPVVEPAGAPVEPAGAPAGAPVVEPAGVPAGAPAEATAQDDDDLDLGALELDPSGGGFDDALQIYGFADFTWNGRWSSSPYIPDAQEFGVGNVNLYLRKNLTPRWRALTEVRLLFSPNGSYAADGSYIDTAVGDPANVERLLSWGGISIERVYLEYDVAPWLGLRAGHWLTPYGIWNIDHGSPTIIGVARPYLVGEQFFPEHQTGLELFGTRPLGELTVEYRATLSNGRNPYEATRDPDRRPAVGGRLAVELPWWGRTRLGISAYAGRATEATAVLTPGLATVVAAYDEVAFGVDAAVDLGGLHLQGEWLTQQRNYREGERATRPGVGFAPDAMAWGMYGLAGYRFTSMGNAMPYAMVERYHAIDPTRFGAVLDVTAGINLRPTPAVVLKAELTYGRFSDGGLFAEETVQLLRLQTAWVF